MYISASLEKWLRYLNLDINNAMKRCENMNGYGNCENVWYIMAVKKCPEGFNRLGCCTCVKSCPEGYKENGELCMMPKNIKNSKYPTLKACRVDNPKRKNDCMLWGQRLYGLKCQKGTKRNEQGKCTPVCPKGWPVYKKDSCIKIGTIRIPDYYLWMNADGQTPREEL